jgi:hypothetical protein
MEAMMWLKVVFSVVLLGSLFIGFIIVFFGLVDEEARQQARAIRAVIRAARKKASLARKKAKKRAWHNERDEWFKEFACCPSKGNQAAITAHLANKPQ